MKKKYLVLFFVLLYTAAFSQEELLDKDVDALFDDTGDGESSGKKKEADNDIYSINTSENPAVYMLRPGFGIDASYSVGLGIFPGFSETPWNFNTPGKFDQNYERFDVIIGASMSATLGLTIQPSSMLRVRQTVKFEIPANKASEIPISFQEFFLDYNLLNVVYFRAGKFDIHWGTSPNFPYTDLLSRLPASIESPGDAYTVRAEVPVGIGGIQFIMMARRGLIADIKKPKAEEFGYGAKFNLAIPFIDVDLGMLYHKQMPLRFFMSVNKTLFSSWEIYAEGMASYEYDNQQEIWNNFLFSYNVGFIQDFFKRRLKINAELYYNAESAGYAVTKNKIKTDEDEKTLLLSNFNTALNVSFNPGIFFNTTFFASFLYSMALNSGQIVPGIRMEPIRHLKIFLTLQMAIGSRDNDYSYYYTNTDTANRPFAVSLIVILNGIYNFSKFDD